MSTFVVTHVMMDYCSDARQMKAVMVTGATVRRAAPRHLWLGKHQNIQAASQVSHYSFMHNTHCSCTVTTRKKWPMQYGTRFKVVWN